MKIAKLIERYRARCIHHQILTSAVFWKSNDVTNVRRVRNQHEEPVNTERDSAGRRRPERERFNQVPEKALLLLGRNTQRCEDPLLYLSLMNSQTAAANLHSI